MKKRVMAILVTVSMALSSLTACGGEAGAQTAGSGATNGETAAQAVPDSYTLEAATFPMRTALNRNGVKSRESTPY